MQCKKLVPSISIYLQGESQQYDQNYYIKEERTCDDASCLCWHTNVTHVTHQFSEFSVFSIFRSFSKTDDASEATVACQIVTFFVKS